MASASAGRALSLLFQTTFFLALLGSNRLLHQLNGLIHPFTVGAKQRQILLNAIDGQTKALSKFLALLDDGLGVRTGCLLYTSPSPRDS